MAMKGAGRIALAEGEAQNYLESPQTLLLSSLIAQHSLWGGGLPQRGAECSPPLCSLWWSQVQLPTVSLRGGQVELGAPNRQNNRLTCLIRPKGLVSQSLCEQFVFIPLQKL